MEEFKIYEENNKQIIEHLIFPKFKGEIIFNSPVSDVEHIEFFDDCTDVMILAKLMREAGEFIANFNNTNLEDSSVLEDEKEIIEERFVQVQTCLNSQPIKISVKSNERCPTANLNNGMLSVYHGCGEGTAYVKDNSVIAWHYGDKQPSNAPKDAKIFKVSLSCTQICFF